MATYKIKPSLSSLKEGQTLSTTVETTGLKAGTKLFWSVSGTGVTTADFRSGSLAGAGTVVIPKGAKAGSFKFSHVPAMDGLNEGDEKAEIKLFLDAARTKQVGLATSVTITDAGAGAGGAVTPAVVPGAPVATEIYQPPFTPFAVEKWKSPVPVPDLKVPLNGNFANPAVPGVPQVRPGKGELAPANFGDPNRPGIAGVPWKQPLGASYKFPQVDRYQEIDAPQTFYGGVADELWKPNVVGTGDAQGNGAVPYYTNGDPIQFYEQVMAVGQMKMVDAVGRPDLKTTIYGYDAVYPGPTFKTKVGAPVLLRSTNRLPTYPGVPAPLFQRTGVHVHGGHNAAHADGYPSFVLNPAANGNPGMTRDYYYANTVPMKSGTNEPDFTESPSTMWYHDHGEDLTDLNVVLGQAGFWFAFDDQELALIRDGKIPGWWDKDKPFNEAEFLSKNSPYDVGLAISDRRFNADGSIYYDGFPVGKNMDGYLGDVQLVNGQAYPYMNVENTQYRFRMLGASTARVYHLRIEDANGVVQPHLRIGNDTWLNPNPIEMKEFTMSPAMRSDMVMDFSRYAPGTVLYLVNTAEQTSGRGPKGKLDDLGQGTYKEKIMKFVVGEKAATTPVWNDANRLTPTTLLRENHDILPSEIAKSRTFAFGRSGGMWVINQIGFDAHKSNAPMPVNTAEEWILENGSGGWWHPIHIHLESHQLQTINGVAPSPTYWPEKQWKSDTTLLGPNTTAKIYMKFRTFEGPFAFHCHILQHEDSMMMFNFDPHDPFDQGYQAGDPIPHDRDYTPTLYPHRPDGHAAATEAAPGIALGGHGGHKHGGKGKGKKGKNRLESLEGAPSEVSQAQLQSFSSSSWGGKKGERMEAKQADEYLNGRDGNDELIGFTGHDMLVGGSGDDKLSGGDGHDVIAGEYGSDRLSGGAGQDLFRFVTMDEGHTDVITDFRGGEDRICFNLALVNTNGPDSKGWTFIKADDFSGRKGEVRFEAGLLQADLNGDGRADAAAKLLGVKSFSSDWLVPFEAHPAA